MKSSDLTKEQKVELEKFGANTWFVEYLHKQYEENPDGVSEQWQNFFGKVSSGKKNNGDAKNIMKESAIPFPNVKLPEPQPDDRLQIIAGSAAKILDNMNASLTIPVATSQRTIPVKLLEENRILINQNLYKKNQRKISFTHLIAWAIVKAIMTNPVMNNAFTLIDGKPNVIKRNNINLGLAIDIEKKDGSHSLIVPNIKKSNTMNFSEFVKAYDDLIDRSRKALIDPSEFQGTTVTLTNPGTIGTISSVPRLMIGQGTIVATGAIQYPVEYQAMAPSTISALGISKVMNITSTYDHRIIQGAESGYFLKEINDLLLGANFFYEEIFEDLKVPLVPLSWQSDSQSQTFGNHSNREETEKQGRVLQLINLYRVRGHLIASFDPLGSQLAYHAELDPASYKLTLWDLDREFITGGFGGIPTATLRVILEILQKTYCEKIGVEYMHIQNPAEKLWLQNKMEPVKNIPHFDADMKKEILNKLIIVEAL